MSYIFDFKIVSHFIIFITFFNFCLYSAVLISQKEFSAVFMSWYFLAVQNTEVGKGVSISSHLIFQETSFWHRCFSTSYSHSLLPKSVNNSAFSNFSLLNFSFFFRSFLWKKNILDETYWQSICTPAEVWARSPFEIDSLSHAACSGLSCEPAMTWFQKK